MTTLHIEHPVSDFELWSSAFQRFEDARRSAGVRSHRVQRPIDDPKYVVIDLDFDAPEQARSFLQFLQTNVWGNRANSPALAGDPQTMILEPATAG